MNEEPPPIDSDKPAEAVFEIVDEENKPSKKPYAIMSIVCLALSGALLTVSISKNAANKTTPASEVAALKIQLADLEYRVQKKRQQAGLEPATPKAETAEEMAANAQQSIQDLVEYSKSYQSLLDKKDIELLQKQQEIEDLNKEVDRLKQLLQRIQLNQ